MVLFVQLIDKAVSFEFLEKTDVGEVGWLGLRGFRVFRFQLIEI
jgi:hypothetical protein